MNRTEVTVVNAYKQGLPNSGTYLIEHRRRHMNQICVQSWPCRFDNAINSTINVQPMSEQKKGSHPRKSSYLCPYNFNSPFKTKTDVSGAAVDFMPIETFNDFAVLNGNHMMLCDTEENSPNPHSIGGRACHVLSQGDIEARDRACLSPNANVDEQSKTANAPSVSNLEPCYIPLFAAHDTVRNILEYVSKKVTTHRCSLSRVNENGQIVVENEWPQRSGSQYFTIPTILSYVEGDMIFAVERHHLPITCIDQEFFDANGSVSLLLAPIRSPQAPDKIVGLLSFASDTLREWTQENKLFLRLARDLITATVSHMELFINMNSEVARFSAIDVMDRLSVEQRGIIDQIVALFERMRRRSTINDLWESAGKSAFKDRVARFMVSNQAIHMSLPAFPMKSPATDSKVIDTMPDMGEALALANLHTFAQHVSKLYPPGCKILVISDGRVFNDLYPVPDDTVSAYSRCIHSLGQEHLQFVGLDQLFSCSESKSKRDALVSFYGYDVESVATKLRTDAHFRQIYMAFKMLLSRDIGVRRTSAAQTAKVMMLRNESYSNLIRILFPHHIRLSIHDHSGTEKIGVHLVGQSIITPWHGVAVRQKHDTWTIMTKQAAIEMGCVLDDAMSPENRDEILNQTLVSLKLAENELFPSLPFYREIS